MNQPRSNCWARRRAAAALILGLSLGVSAHADCADGVREATAAELDFNARAYAALVALLPPPPANTTLRGTPRDASKPERTPSFCKSDREGAFEVIVGAAYLHTWPRGEADRLSAERKQILRQVDALEALPPEQAARHDALVQQAREAFNSQPRAKRGGPPLSDAERQLAGRKIAEGNALDEQARAILKAHRERVAPDVNVLRAKADALQASPQELGVQLRLNAARLETAGETRRVQSKAHGQPRKGGLVVHNVVVAVGGPEGEARQRLWDALDQARIQAMVGAPLPSVAESARLSLHR